jgi:tagatose 6-phosphate kinase
MILSVCLSPTLQRTLSIDVFSMGRVNRATSVNLGVGGKGINAARVATQLGEKVLCLACLGGPTGREVVSILRHQHIPSAVIRTKSSTRICTTILSQGSETELVEEPAPVLPNEIKAFSELFTKHVPPSRFVILSGTVSSGFPITVYRELGAAAASRGIPFLVDAVGPIFIESLKAKPNVIKVNRHELEACVGWSCDSQVTIDRAMRKLVTSGAQSVLITGWQSEAWALIEGHRYLIRFPKLQAINTIGSGDAASAGIAVALVRGQTLLESFRFGVACASANVLTPTAGSVRAEDVKRILKQVTVEAVQSRSE